MSHALQDPAIARRGMVRIPGGTFRMGSEHFYAEERPIRTAHVESFWIDHQLVTVRQFKRFVAETQHVTVAERAPDPAQFPDADPALLVPGSLVFVAPPRPVPLHDHRVWWHWVPGASWRHPAGPGSTVVGHDRHPVVHIAHADAVAYATWAGTALPTEAEWECAARGGLDGATFAWGEEEQPNGQVMANTWQGSFPWQNLGAKGHRGTSPSGAFPPNGYGLYDMIGNVWEWTADAFGATGEHDHGDGCCSPAPAVDDAPRNVIKGGSHLCAASYCLRYRPAARQGHELDSSTSHLGFRCVVRDRVTPAG